MLDYLNYWQKIISQLLHYATFILFLFFARHNIFYSVSYKNTFIMNIIII